jgi:O-antigen ligase
VETRNGDATVNLPASPTAVAPEDGSRLAGVSAALDAIIATGFLAVVIVTALAHGAVEPWSIALFEFMLIVLLALWALKAILDKRLDLSIPGVLFPMLALLALGLAQSLAWTDAFGQRRGLSLDIEATRESVVLLGFLILGFLIAVNVFASRERILLAAHTLTIFGAILAVFALVQYFTWDGRFFWLRPTPGSSFGPFVNRAHFAGYMALIVPVPLGLIVSGVRAEARVFYGFAAALMGTAAIVSGSRGGTLSLALALVFMAVVQSRAMRRGHRPSGSWVSRAAPIALSALAMVAGFLWVGAGPMLERFGSAVDQFLDTGTADVGRAEIWQGTLEMIRDLPVTGAGIGAFTTAYPTYALQDSGGVVSYAHNDYLQVLADTGGVGGVIVLGFLIVAAATISRALRSGDAAMAGIGLGAATGMFAIGVHSISDTHLQVPSNALLFLFLLAIVSSVATAARQGPPDGLAAYGRQEILRRERAYGVSDSLLA